MSSLESSLKAAMDQLYREPVPVTPTAVRGLVEHLGGGNSKREIAAGNKALAAELGVNVRTVQRWQKEPGESGHKPGASSEARNPARSKQAPALQRRAAQQRIREHGVHTSPAQVQVHVYDEKRSRSRNIPGEEIDGETMGAVLDALNDGKDTQAAELFNDAWLQAYGLRADAEITDVVGQLQLGY